MNNNSITHVQLPIVNLGEIAKSGFNPDSIVTAKDEFVTYRLNILINIIQYQLGLTNGLADYQQACDLISQCLTIVMVGDSYEDDWHKKVNSTKKKLDNYKASKGTKPYAIKLVEQKLEWLQNTTDLNNIRVVKETFDNKVVETDQYNHWKKFVNRDMRLFAPHIDFLFASGSKKKGQYLGLNSLDYIAKGYLDGVVPDEVVTTHMVLSECLSNLFSDMKLTSHASLLVSQLKTCIPLGVTEDESIKLIIVDDNEHDAHVKWGVGDCHARMGIGITSIISKSFPQYTPNHGIQFRIYLDGIFTVKGKELITSAIAKGSMFHSQDLDPNTLVIPRSCFKSSHIPNNGEYILKPNKLSMLLGIREIYKIGSCKSDVAYYNDVDTVDEVLSFAKQAIDMLNNQASTMQGLLQWILQFQNKEWDETNQCLIPIQPKLRIDHIEESSKYMLIDDSEDEENDSDELSTKSNYLLDKILEILACDKQAKLYNHPLVVDKLNEFIGSFYKQIALKGAIKGRYLVACPYNYLDMFEQLPIYPIICNHYAKWYKEQTGEDITVKGIKLIISTSLPYGLYKTIRHPIKGKDDYQLYYVINPQLEECTRMFEELGIEVNKSTSVANVINMLWYRYIGNGWISRIQLCYWRNCFWIGSKAYATVGGDFDGDKSLFEPLEAGKVDKWYGGISLSQGQPSKMIELLKHHSSPWNTGVDHSSRKKAIKEQAKKLTGDKYSFYVNALGNATGLVNWTTNLLYLFMVNNKLELSNTLMVNFPEYNSDGTYKGYVEAIKSIKDILNELEYQLQLAVDGFKHGSYPCLEFISSIPDNGAIKSWTESLAVSEGTKADWLKYLYSLPQSLEVKGYISEIKNPMAKFLNLWLYQKKQSGKYGHMRLAYQANNNNHFIHFGYKGYIDCVSTLCNLCHDMFTNSNVLIPYQLETYRDVLYPQKLDINTRISIDGELVRAIEVVKYMLDTFTAKVKSLTGDAKQEAYLELLTQAQNLTITNIDVANVLCQYTWELAHNSKNSYGTIAFVLWTDLIKKHLSVVHQVRAFKLQNKSVPTDIIQHIEGRNFKYRMTDDGTLHTVSVQDENGNWHVVGKSYKNQDNLVYKYNNTAFTVPKFVASTNVEVKGTFKAVTTTKDTVQYAVFVE